MSRGPHAAALPALLACLLAAAPAPAQEVAAPLPPTTDSAAPVPWQLSVGGFHHRLNRGYGSWRGVDLRLQRGAARVSPFFALSSQTRDEGTQANVGAGSYLTLTRWAYAIVGISAAPAASATLYPRLRWDLTGLVNVPGAPGLVATAGVTGLDYEGPVGGRIHSLGALYYRGEAILSGVVRLNTDRPSGARSSSAQLALQVGRQGRSWLGGSIGGGDEAYTVLAAAPFEARFRGMSAAIFHQRWLAPRHGFTVRYEFEHKFDAYIRNGVSAWYFLDFSLP